MVYLGPSVELVWTLAIAAPVVRFPSDPAINRMTEQIEIGSKVLSDARCLADIKGHELSTLF